MKDLPPQLVRSPVMNVGLVIVDVALDGNGSRAPWKKSGLAVHTVPEMCVSITVGDEMHHHLAFTHREHLLGHPAVLGLPHQDEATAYRTLHVGATIPEMKLDIVGIVLALG